MIRKIVRYLIGFRRKHERTCMQLDRMRGIYYQFYYFWHVYARRPNGLGFGDEWNDIRSIFSYRASVTNSVTSF